MSSDDVERLYRMLAELRDEVHGYRADLNGRLRTLEVANASRTGAENQRSISNARIAVWAGIIITGVSLGVSILLHFLDRL